MSFVGTVSGIFSVARALHELPLFVRLLIAVMGTALYVFHLYVLFGSTDWKYATAGAAFPDSAALPKPAAIIVPPPLQKVFKQIGISNRMHVTYVQSSQQGVQHNDVELLSANGGHAHVDVYIVYLHAAWKFGETEFEDRQPIMDFLHSDAFRRDHRQHQALICVGLASYLDPGDPAEAEARGLKLSKERAETLCDMILYDTTLNSDAVKLFGFGLGRHVPGGTEPERQQRSILILGIRDATGDLATEKGRQEVIRQMLIAGFDNFNPGAYSVLALRQPIKWMQFSLHRFGKH